MLDMMVGFGDVKPGNAQAFSGQLAHKLRGNVRDTLRDKNGQIGLSEVAGTAVKTDKSACPVLSARDTLRDTLAEKKRTNGRLRHEVTH